MKQFKNRQTIGSIEELLNSAFENCIFIHENEGYNSCNDGKKRPIVNYTLKQLTILSFEKWADLIDLENNTNNA